MILNIKNRLHRVGRCYSCEHTSTLGLPGIGQGLTGFRNRLSVSFSITHDGELL